MPSQPDYKKRSGALTLALILALAAVVLLGVLLLARNGGQDAAPADAPVQETLEEIPQTAEDPTQDVPDPADAPDAAAAEAPEAAADAPAVTGDPLTVYVIDVGQGDSILLVSPSGRTMLIDAGDADHYDAVMGTLSDLDIDRIDVLVATHPHGDHIGAMGRLVKNIEVGACYLTEYPSNIFAYTRLLDALEQYNVPTCTTDTDTRIAWDADCPVTVLSPVAGVAYEDLNASSIVLRVDYGDTSVLLAGDATIEAEDIMLATFPADAFSADVLKIAHHGSSDATSERFLDAVDPSVVAASLGAGNDYGHPHREILAMLSEHGLKLLRTDELGTIKIVLDGAAATVVE